MILIVVPFLLLFLGLFVVGFWWPLTAFIVLAMIVVLLELLFVVEDRAHRPRFQQVAGSMYMTDHPFFRDVWIEPDALAIRQYHLFLRIPIGAKTGSTIVNSVRWLSLVLWLPLMLWSELWIPAALIVIHFFISGPLAVKLDPLTHLASSRSTDHQRLAQLLSNLLEKLHSPVRFERTRSPSP